MTELLLKAFGTFGTYQVLIRDYCKDGEIIKLNDRAGDKLIMNYKTAIDLALVIKSYDWALDTLKQWMHIRIDSGEFGKTIKQTKIGL